MSVVPVIVDGVGKRELLCLMWSVPLAAWLTGLPNELVAASQLALVMPDTSFDGYGRKARDILNNMGVCGSLVDATASQYAAALEAIRFPLVRTNGVTSAGSGLNAMQAIRSAQNSLGSVRPALFNCILMGYNNDITPLATQLPQVLSMINAGVLWGVEAPNEINNTSTGNGSRGPNDTTNKTANGAYQLNFIDWATQLKNFKAANLAAFNQYGVVTLSSSLSPVSGTSSDYETGNMVMESLSDYWNMHFYAGHGFQPSLPFGADPNTGYFSNVAGWAKTGYSPTGLRQGVLTECGATTMGQPGYARSGLSQAKYLANQQMEAFALNLKAMFVYQLFDGNGTAGDTEGNFGLFMSDKATPKPAATMLGRMQNIRALNNNANHVANVSDWANKPAFKPGLNVSQCAVVGLTNPPNGMRPYLAEYKSDGSTVLWVWNEPVIDSDSNVGEGGTDVTPANDAVTVYLPRSRQWRIQDPLGTASLTAGAFTTSDTVAITLKGYPMAIELPAPSGWTASGGDPADVPLTGFGTFQVGKINNNFVRNYGGAQPDDLFVTIGPPSGQLFTPGNYALIVAVTPSVNVPTCAGATFLGKFKVSSVAGAAFFVFKALITNKHSTFTVTGVDSSASAVAFEVAPFTTFSASASLCTWTGNNYDSGNTLTAPLAAVPTGSLGLFAIGVPNESGGESYSQSSDTSVVIKAPIINDPQAYAAQGWGGTIAAGRAAGNVTWPANNINYATGQSPVALTVVIAP